MRVAFLYNAQNHQVPHSLPVACELSRLPGISVAVLTRTVEQMELARRLSRLYPDNRLTFDMLRPPPLVRRLSAASKLAKFASLITNRRRLNSFDALVVPERTSLLLKRFGVTGPRYIHTFHGSSGHDRLEDPRLPEFDLLLAPSARRLERLADVNGPRPRNTAVIGYSKLDLVRRMGDSRARLFSNSNPTILYNPHHWADKSSWHVAGRCILDHFKKQKKFNLVFAPHARLFDPPERHEPGFADYSDFDHILIDLGSERGIDMTYTHAADIYLGDVSSQVFEFVIRPRPCIFLNLRNLAWEDDADFASWQLGRVVRNLPELDEALATIERWQPEYAPLQRASAAANFPELGTPAPLRGARAIAAFLRHGELWPGWDNGDEIQACGTQCPPAATR
ncbi:MAG: sensor domain-containing protein [Lysobacterales bacterium]|nr:MAG: sensor domain-containing protein [Xanthomonadales bacterium]